MLAANMLATLLMVAIVGQAHTQQDIYEITHTVYQGKMGDRLQKIEQPFVVKTGQCSAELSTKMPMICGKKRITSLEVTTSGYSGNPLLVFEPDLSLVTIRRRNCDSDLLVEVRVACHEPHKVMWRDMPASWGMLARSIELEPAGV